MLRLWFYTELHRVSFELDSVERATQSVLLVWFKRVKVKFLRKNCPLEGTLGVLRLLFYTELHRVSFEVDCVERATQSVLLVWVF